MLYIAKEKDNLRYIQSLLILYKLCSIFPINFFFYEYDTQYLTLEVQLYIHCTVYFYSLLLENITIENFSLRLFRNALKSFALTIMKFKVLIDLCSKIYYPNP